jgi:hypothetical protein
MANADNANGFQYQYRYGGSPVPIAYGTVDTNISIAEGDALVLEDDGYLALATATKASTLGIWGIAKEAVTGAAGVRPEIALIPASKDIVFMAQTSGTASVGLRGSSVTLEGTTGIQEINEDGTTKGLFRVIDKHPDDTWAANTRLYVTVSWSGWEGDV